MLGGWRKLPHGHQVRGLRVPVPNSRGHATKRGLRVPNPNSRGHATKCGLRVPNPNSRNHATKGGLRVPNLTLRNNIWFLKDRPAKGDKIRSGYSPLPSRGPKREPKCYVIPSFSGVPDAKRGEKIRKGLEVGTLPTGIYFQ